MNKLKIIVVTALLGGLLFTAGAYDVALAKQILHHVTGQMNREFMTAPGSKIVVNVAEVLDLLKKHEKILLLDVRTVEEHAVVALSHAQSMFIPLNELFKQENLDRLPQDGKIIVVCHSTTRAAFAVGLLQAIGFKNVQFLKGGLVELATDINPKNVPTN